MLPAQSAQAMLEGMVSTGLDRERLLRAANIDSSVFSQPEASLEISCFSQLWQAAFLVEPRDTLPLEVGLKVPYGAFGALDFLAGTSATVAAAFQSLSIYLKAVNPSVDLRIEPHEKKTYVVLKNLKSYDRMEVSDIFTIGVLLNRFRTLSSQEFSAIVEVAMPPPQNPAKWEQIAKTKIYFGRPVSTLIIDNEVFGAKMRSADERLHETLQTLAMALQLGSFSDDLEGAIRLRLRSSLPQGRSDASSMAKSLGMSERTLQRRLVTKGKTYQEIVEDFRHEEALRLLANAKLSLTEVAMRLGFSEQSSFTRAFKRWTGQSPGAQRQGQRA